MQKTIIKEVDQQTKVKALLKDSSSEGLVPKYFVSSSCLLKMLQTKEN